MLKTPRLQLYTYFSKTCYRVLQANATQIPQERQGEGPGWQILMGEIFDIFDQDQSTQEHQEALHIYP